MTTPRVTEIPLELAPVKADSFVEASPRTSAAQRRLSDREAQGRQANLVRSVIRLRAVRAQSVSRFLPRGFTGRRRVPEGLEDRLPPGQSCQGRLRIDPVAPVEN
jgi:hypothetical protein